MNKAETVEGLLSPSLRVSRPVAACSRCRGAKIKCDGKLPACTACEKAGKGPSCSGANDEFAKGKERSYVAALEGACERLQKRIAEARAARDLNTANRGSLSPASARTGRILGGNRMQKQEASDVDDLVGDFGFLSVNATSRDFHGFTGTTSFAKLLLTMSVKKSLPDFSSRQLPPRYYATQLVQRYLDTVHVLMPLVSETDLMSSLAAVYQDTGRQARAFDHWTVRMVLAIAIASMVQSNDTTTQRQALHQVSAAFEVAEEVLHPGSIAGLQAILLLTQYSMIDAEYFRSWQLIGIASRVLVDLGLHQEPSVEDKIGKALLETRRRDFYALYCMDRQISMASNQSFSFTDDSTSVKQPTTQQASSTSNEALFLHSIQPSLLLTEIRRIQSVPYQTLYQSSRQPLDDSDSANAFVWSVYWSAQEWYDSIPAAVFQQHQTLFKLELLYTQLFILSPSIRISSIPNFHKGLFFELSLDFAERMQTAIQNIGWHPFLSYPDVLRIYNVGKTFLDILWEAYDPILSGQISAPRNGSPDTNAPQPPKYKPSTDMLNNVDRALRFFNQTVENLEYAHQRWGINDLRDRYEQEAAVMMGKLRLKQAQLRQRQGAEQASQQEQLAEGQMPPSYAFGAPVRHSQNPQYSHQWSNPTYQSMSTDRGSSSLQGHPMPSFSQPQMEQPSHYDITEGQAHPSRHTTYSNSHAAK